MTDLTRDHLQTLIDISRAISSTLDLHQVLDLVMEQVIAVTRAGRGFLMLADEQGGLTFRVARGIDREQIDKPESAISQGIIEAVARTRRPLLTSNAQTDQRLADRSSIVLKDLRSVLCVPLLIQDRFIGLVYVDNRLRQGVFDQASLDLLTAFAGQAAIALENARLYGLALEKGRMERELSMARDIQRGLLPESPPAVPGFELATFWQSAREVSGDFYDFIPLPPGDTGVLIADVSDKGAPAALFMAVARSLIRASAVTAATPADALMKANRLIAADAKSGMFVTAFYAVLGQDGTITCCAGHNPPLIYRAASASVDRLSEGGVALGVMEDVALENRPVSLAPGDVLFLYTDGFTEATNADGQYFGEDRLRQALQAAGRKCAAEIVDAIWTEFRIFVEPVAPTDDLTLIVVRRNPSQAEDGHRD